MSEDPIMSDIKSAQGMTDKNLKKLELAQVLDSDNAERPPPSELTELDKKQTWCEWVFSCSCKRY